jgi:hypothetical protein
MVIVILLTVEPDISSAAAEKKEIYWIKMKYA